jgi:hypothetical protein
VNLSKERRSVTHDHAAMFSRFCAAWLLPLPVLLAVRRALFRCVEGWQHLEICFPLTNLGSMATSDSTVLAAAPAPAFNSRKAVVDALAGSVSGLCGVIVGQPFDTIRVRQQTKSFSSSSGSSMISLIRENFHSMPANVML